MATHKNQPRDNGPDAITTQFHVAAADLSLVGNNVKARELKNK